MNSQQILCPNPDCKQPVPPNATFCSSCKKAIGHPTEPAATDRSIGEWRLGRALGKGSYGQVFEAQHKLEPTRSAAVKIMHGMLSQPDLQRMFTTEVNALQRLRHDNIVSIQGSGTEDGRGYLVMELLKGHTLSSFLEKNKLLDEAQVRRIGIQVARALAAAHLAGVVHRDLKPDNIVLLPRSDLEGFDVKVLDFGVAMLLADPVRSNVPRGTPRYMPPEQWTAPKDIDGRADIYAMGVILYECLTGRPPYPDESEAERVDLRRLAPDPAERVQVSPLLSRLIRRMLNKDRRMRPQDAREIIDTLESRLAPPLVRLRRLLTWLRLSLGRALYGPAAQLSLRTFLAITTFFALVLSCGALGFFYRSEQRARLQGEADKAATASQLNQIGVNLASERKRRDQELQSHGKEVQKLQAQITEMEARVCGAPVESDRSRKSSKNEAIPETPGEILTLAQAHQSSRRWQQARRLLHAFLKKYPSDPRIPMVLSQLGDTYFAQHRYASAIDVFNYIIAQHPKSEEAGRAVLKGGQAFYALKRTREAGETFQSLLSVYPQTKLPGAARSAP